MLIYRIIYIDIINGRRKEEKIHDVYWQATCDTHGVLIYQEQILKICINIGFDAETAYDILKAVSKKKIEKIKSYEKAFYELGQNKNIEENLRYSTGWAIQLIIASSSTGNRTPVSAVRGRRLNRLTIEPQ